MTVFISPKIQNHSRPLPGPDLSRITFVAPDPLTGLNIDPPDIDFETARNYDARIAAPTLQGGRSLDLTPYIRQAALQPGEGATVVLRVEVLETGEPGRIEIDASSGSARIDQAALKYARMQHWYAGRKNGTPHVMWIRWGIRLQA